jgi:hypothetical protein
VDGIVMSPLEGYSAFAQSGVTCVGSELIWASDLDDPIRTWGRACFDLGPFVGQEIQVSFDFGSDGSLVGAPGWYLAYVKVGSTEGGTGSESQTWGALKTLYR